MRRELHALAVASVVCMLVARVLLTAPVLSGSPLFDEVHYVVSARYLLHGLGLLPSFVPPVESEVLTSGGTVVVRVTVRSWVAVNLLGADWRNLEHPAAAKLLIGALLALLGSLPAARLALLGISALSLACLAHAVLRRWGPAALIGFAALLLADGLYVHLTYLAVLDTPMLALLLPSVAALLGGRHLLALALLSLACACKEQALVLAPPYAAYIAAARRRRGLAALALALPPLATLAGYAPYLAVAGPGEVLGSALAMLRVSDPLARGRLWLLSPVAEWGLFRVLTPLLWLWLAGPALLAARRRVEPERALPYLLALAQILAVVLLAFSRSVYPHHYAPAQALSPIAVADLAAALRYIARGPRGRGAGRGPGPQGPGAGGGGGAGVG